MNSVLSVSWKQEPLSPLSNEEVTWLSEDTFYCTTLKQDDLDLENNSPICESKAEVASQLLEDLENLVDLDELIKEEPFFLDVKVLPILEMEPVKIEYKPPDTQILLNEFESVCNVLDYNHNTLTPPQSPPSEPPTLTTLQPLMSQSQPTSYAIFSEKQHPPSYIVPEKQLQDNALVYPSVVEFPATPQPDIAHELAVVDELVRTRVENMQWSSGPSSPCSNSSSSSSSSNSLYGDYSSEDPEWVPEAVDSYNVEDVVETKTPRKRSKPYSRNHEDKKSRKKEQNKNAATRYRLKKKAEVEEILTEEKQLANESDSLSLKITDLQREIKYLKGLMRDLFKAKGLMN